MILYVDSSAIVKRFISEDGSSDVEKAIAQAEAVGTTTISRAEVVAAFGRAVRRRVIVDREAQTAMRAFNKSWPNWVRTRVTERLVKQAAALAWSHGLRGYDAVQLASASAWRQALERNVTLATFDVQLWNAALKIGLFVFPENLPENGTSKPRRFR